MRKKLKSTKRFEKDYALIKRRGKNVNKLQEIVNHLLIENPLPKKNKLHVLTGEWKNHHECHIEPDWLLIFLLTDDYVVLVRTGSHSDLF